MVVGGGASLNAEFIGFVFIIRNTSRDKQTFVFISLNELQEVSLNVTYHQNDLLQVTYSIYKLYKSSTTPITEKLYL